MRGQKPHRYWTTCGHIPKATILGGGTVIGEGSVIGGNVWLTRSVPPGTKVMTASPELVFVTADT